MSFKRNEADEENFVENGDDDIGQKRYRSDEFGRGRGRGRDRGGRGRGFRDRGFRDGRGRSRGRGFRDRGGFRSFNDNDDNDNDDFGRRGGFNNRGRGRGDRGRGRGDRGRGRGDRGFRGRGRGDRGRGRGGWEGGNREVQQKECAIKVGQAAPEFNEVLNDKSDLVSLKQFRGKYVVLFIYFKNGTYGSKIEQETFRDLKDKFEKLNAVILGVSRDDKDSHALAIKDSNLNYSLLTDIDGEITKAYDAIDENQRVYPSTFIISPEGKIAAVWPKIFGFDKHPQEVLAKLDKILKGGNDDEENKGANEDNDDDNEDDGGDDNDDGGDDNDDGDENDDGGDDDEDDDQE